MVTRRSGGCGGSAAHADSRQAGRTLLSAQPCCRPLHVRPAPAAACPVPTWRQQPLADRQRCMLPQELCNLVTGGAGLRPWDSSDGCGWWEAGTRVGRRGVHHALCIHASHAAPSSPRGRPALPGRTCAASSHCWCRLMMVALTGPRYRTTSTTSALASSWSAFTTLPLTCSNRR